MNLLYSCVLYMYGLDLLPRFLLLVIKGQFSSQNNDGAFPISNLKQSQKQRQNGHRYVSLTLMYMTAHFTVLVQAGTSIKMAGSNQVHRPKPPMLVRYWNSHFHYVKSTDPYRNNILFLFSIVLFVLLRYAVVDYRFGIFKLFYQNSNEQQNSKI